MILRTTGSNPVGKELERMRKSPNYSGKGFANLSPTPMMAGDASYFKATVQFFKKNDKAKPPGLLPTIKTDLNKIGTTKPIIIWFGHSSYFIRINQKNFLVDPVFSGSASPLSFMVKAFPGSDIYSVNDIPLIDCIILTHDHYDHLDYKTIMKLHPKAKAIYCSLGIGSHLRYWGIEATKIHELDWWDRKTLEEGMELTATPARHFSGRGAHRNKTLWSGFVLKTPDYQLYLGGDSGYDAHFKTIGEKFGAFDIVMLESGQYNTMWPNIHMMPEETVQAAADLHAKFLLPVHWGKFSLAMHEWDEPIKRIVQKSAEVKMPVTTPKIGERIILGEEYPQTQWWDHRLGGLH